MSSDSDAHTEAETQKNRILWNWPHRHYLRQGAGDELLGDVVSVLPARLRNSRLLRPLWLLWFGRRFSRVVVGLSGIDNIVYLTLRSVLPGSRNIAILHFIPPTATPGGGGLRARVKRVWIATVLRSVTQRKVYFAQCLTEWERRFWQETFGSGVFEVVPYPLLADIDPASARDLAARRGVFASGRASCDWELVARAVQSLEVPIHLVCSQADLARVKSLVWPTQTVIEVEVPKSRHDELMESARVYLLALREQNVSSGQIRVSDAVRARTPLVSTSVRGVLDYVEDGATALVVKPGDAVAARQAVVRLLNDQHLSLQISAEAHRRATAWTAADYYSALWSRIHR